MKEIKIAQADLKQGRPKGRLDQKPRRLKSQTMSPEQRSAAAKKAAETKRRQFEESRQGGVNPEFEKRLDQLSPPAPGPAAYGPEPELVLQVKDVAESVGWPFVLWAEANKLPDLKLTQSEAISVAEPLTRILNRHHIAQVVNPDWLDGLLAAQRLSPVMVSRFNLIKAERAKRKAGQGGPVNQAGDAGQGRTAPATDKKE